MTGKYYASTIFTVWLLIVTIYAIYYITSVLSLPDLQGYEGDWSFQLFSFCVARLPFLVIVLILCMFFLRRKT